MNTLTTQEAASGQAGAGNSRPARTKAGSPTRWTERKPRTVLESLFYKHLSGARNGILEVRFPATLERKTLGMADKAGRAPAILLVQNDDFFRRCVLSGEIGFGEAYEAGYWESEELGAVLGWFLRNADQTPTFAARNLNDPLVNLLGWWDRLRHKRRRNTKAGSRRNIAEHYDLSNDFFALMLDPTMAYSSGIYERPGSTLHEAQLHKFNKLIAKLQLGPGNHLLEIGTGWGGFAVFAAKRTGCRVTTVTISQEQFSKAQQLVQENALEELVDVRLQDYREIVGSFDRIVSVEMVEALGYEYLDVFFSRCHQLLSPDGIMVLQAITFPDPYYERYRRSVDWSQKYIFPGSLLLSLRETMNSLHRTGDLMVWDVQSIGLDYARTLSDWRENTLRNEANILAMGFHPSFLRRWIYYLTFCEVGFAQRYINDVQLVISRPLNPNLIYPR